VLAAAASLPGQISNSHGRASTAGQHQTPSKNAFVPGTGHRVTQVGDDFEDPNWSYHFQLPKVQNNGDTVLAENLPLGFSNNGRWHEGKKRGQPDSIRRVDTPGGGLPSSAGALALRTLASGGRYPSRTQQQEDFIANVSELTGKIPVSRSPSVIARVWLPPLEQWELRSGCHFAFRIGLETGTRHTGSVRQISISPEENIFWPGLFLNREITYDAASGTVKSDRLYFWMKAASNGYRIDGPDVTTLGWWTLGMSISPDGEVHYFARPGCEELTMADHVASAYPFGKRAIDLRSFFFNVCNGDDGQHWSTEFIIDDPSLFILR
jgi:hypothetical protein